MRQLSVEMSRFSLIRAFANTIAESRAVDVFKVRSNVTFKPASVKDGCVRHRLL